MSSRHPFFVVGSIVAGFVGGIAVAAYGVHRDKRYEEACRLALLAKLAEFPDGLEFRLADEGPHPLLDVLRTVPVPRGSFSAMMSLGLRVVLALQALEERGWISQGTKKMPERLQALFPDLKVRELPDWTWKLTDLGKQQLKPA